MICVTSSERSTNPVNSTLAFIGHTCKFASGNRAILNRTDASGRPERYRLRLYDLLNNGDIRANAVVMPGDVIVIPQSYF